VNPGDEHRKNTGASRGRAQTKQRKHREGVGHKETRGTFKIFPRTP